MKLKYLIIYPIALLVYSQVTGQNKTAWSKQYQDGKEFLNSGRYKLAMQTLKPLTSEFDNDVDVRYASFYYAVAAWYNGDVIESKNIFLQLQHKYPTWNRLDEVNVWLIKIYFDQGQFELAKKLMQDLHSKELRDKAQAVEADYLSSLSYDELYQMITGDANDSEIAKALADKIIEKPFSDQDRALLENIVTVFELDPEKYQMGELKETVRKDTYQVAILLPFLYEDLENPQARITNRFVIDLYEGIKKGNEALRQQGINLKLHAYDTKKDPRATLEILELPELKHMDLIIGPLWPDPVQLVSEFSFSNKINMINPLSFNQEIIDKNPYAFLFMPSNQTLGTKAADFMANQEMENKNFIIFYGSNEKDSTLAFDYKQTLEEAGYQLCHIEKVPIEEGKRILDILTNTVTIELDEDEYDSLVKHDADRRGTLKITEKDMLVIAPDSIGHVLVASGKAPLAANAITALQTRGDHITLVGKYQWLNYNEISMELLEQLNAHLIAPAYIDKTKPAYSTLLKSYLQTHQALPGNNLFIGYDLITIMGHLMHQFGTHFQKEEGASRFFNGTFTQGLIFDGHNNNQYVPIVKFRDSELHIINPFK